MYIFELLYKITVKLIQKKPKPKEKKEDEICEHIFLPIDSTKKILACSKCGLVVKADSLKPKSSKNPFSKQ